MKSIVVQTYFHLLHAIALTLDKGLDARLYVSRSFLDFSDDLIARIEDTGLFGSVTTIQDKGDLDGFLEAMRRTEGMDDAEIDRIGSSIFEEYLTPYYADRFAEADPEEEIILYNDSQWYFYYIANRFKDITVAEDGYGVIARMLESKEAMTKLNRTHSLRARFVGKYFPPPLFRHENVRRVIGSVALGQMPAYLEGRFEVDDFRDMVERNRARFGETVRSIFDVAGLPEGGGEPLGTLVIGQPLHRVHLCDEGEEYLLHRRMIEEYWTWGKPVWLKPHPAETLDFGALGGVGVNVLPKDFPIELFDCLGIRFERAVSFASAALDTIGFAEEKIRVFQGDGVSVEETQSFIKDYVAGERFRVGIYMPVRRVDERTKACIRKYASAPSGIHVNIYTVCPGEEVHGDLARAVAEMYPDGPAKDMHIEILSGIPLDAWGIFEGHARGCRANDFFLILESDMPANHIARAIAHEVGEHGWMLKALLFTEYVKRDAELYPMPIGRVKGYYTPRISNRLYRRECVYRMEDILAEDSVSDAMRGKPGHVAYRRTRFLYRDLPRKSLRPRAKDAVRHFEEELRVLAEALAQGTMAEEACCASAGLLCGDLAFALLLAGEAKARAAGGMDALVSLPAELLLGAVQEEENQAVLAAAVSAAQEFLKEPPEPEGWFSRTEQRLRRLRGKE
ncbi:MAG: glycosyltransferase family 52 protein [Clostridiales Family XIII bacterium]|jgi:hypothetical protein|nr:glycosyltransferase family 52 protein [Clostridiales Family XIII bacterium]